MRYILALSLLLCLSFSSFAEDDECYTLVKIIELTQETDGIVYPLESYHVRVLSKIGFLPKDALNNSESFYVQDSGGPVFRVFNMKNGCADRQWMVPQEFLLLLGLIKA